MLALCMKLAGAAFAVAACAAATPLTTKRTSSGCGGSDHHSGFNNDTAHGGHGFPLGDRTYSILIPPGYDNNHSYPLIVDYHGNHGTSYSQYLTSQYDKFDTSGDFVVVYPQGVNKSWEGPTYHHSKENDLSFTVELVEHIRENYCINESRIYASGKSNGGGFVGTLACADEGSGFAAFAMSSAALYTDNLSSDNVNLNCTPSRPLLPIMEVHGSKDSIIHYWGGNASGGIVPAIPDWLNAWGGIRDGGDGPHPDYPTKQYGDSVNMTTYTVGNNVAVTGLWIENMEHCWASVEPNHDWDNFGDNCTSPLNATTLFLDYFNNWDLNGFIGK